MRPRQHPRHPRRESKSTNGAESGQLTKYRVHQALTSRAK